MDKNTSFFKAETLFQGDQGGYATYRIPTLAVTTHGTLLAFCEARKTGRGDWDHIDILLRRSTDDSATWSEPVKMNRVMLPIDKNPVALAQNIAGSDERTFNNPVIIVGGDGVLHFLHCAEYARCFYLRSDDDGLTWTEPVEITATFEAFRPEYDWKVIATGPGHGIQLKNGRLIVPVWMSIGTGGHAHRPSVVSVIVSDDNGATWQRGDVAVWHTEATPNPSETVALQLNDSRVMLNVRTESPRHRRVVVFSDDGATGWSASQFDEGLFEPICFGSLIRYSEEPSRILFCNPDSRNTTKEPYAWGAWPRENLTVKLSHDEGQTWPVAKVIDPGVAGYSDIATGPDGTIYVLYEGGSRDGDMFNNTHMTLAMFNLAWLGEN